MKTVLMKIFLIVSAMACMLQGMMLLSVGLGRLPAGKLVNLYEQLMNIPAALKTVEIVGVFFVLLGFILLVFAARAKQVPKMIKIEEDGQSLNITYKTIIDYIEQIGSQDPYVTHFLADFINDRKEGVIIPVQIELNGVPSVQQVLNEIEHTLRDEIENVFGLKKFKFDFHIKGVSIDPKKKYFASPVVEKAPLPAAMAVSAEALPAKEVLPAAWPVAEALPPLVKVHVPQVEALEESFAMQRSQEEIEELIETQKNDPKKTSFVTRILWGK